MSTVFSGLSAFPITPLKDQQVDFDGLERVFARLNDSGIDSVGVLGSTGGYAYLSHYDRQRIIRFAGRQLTKPWIAGVTALNRFEVMEHCAAAVKAGAGGVMLAAQSYLPLQHAEVERLFVYVAEHSPLPVLLYNNPGTTGIDLPLELIARLAQHPNIAAIKYPAGNPQRAVSLQARLMSAVDGHASIGYSVDGSAGYGILAGGEAWFSALAGVWPQPFVDIMAAARRGNRKEVDRLYTAMSDTLKQTSQAGSLKVAHAIAAGHGLATPELPWPLGTVD